MVTFIWTFHFKCWNVSFLINICSFAIFNWFLKLCSLHFLHWLPLPFGTKANLGPPAFLPDTVCFSNLRYLAVLFLSGWYPLIFCFIFPSATVLTSSLTQWVLCRRAPHLCLCCSPARSAPPRSEQLPNSEIIWQWHPAQECAGNKLGLLRSSWCTQTGQLEAALLSQSQTSSLGAHVVAGAAWPQQHRSSGTWRLCRKGLLSNSPFSLGALGYHFQIFIPWWEGSAASRMTKQGSAIHFLY